MEMICFFILVSCAIYGAAELFKLIYGVLVSLLAKIYNIRRKNKGRSKP